MKTRKKKMKRCESKKRIKKVIFAFNDLLFTHVPRLPLSKYKETINQACRKDMDWFHELISKDNGKFAGAKGDCRRNSSKNNVINCVEG